MTKTKNSVVLTIEYYVKRLSQIVLWFKRSTTPREREWFVFNLVLLAIALFIGAGIMTAPARAQSPVLGYANDGRVCCECWKLVTPTPPETIAIEYVLAFYANEYGLDDCGNVCWTEHNCYTTVEMIGGYKTERGCREYGFYMPLIQKSYSFSL